MIDIILRSNDQPDEDLLKLWKALNDYDSHNLSQALINSCHGDALDRHFLKTEPHIVLKAFIDTADINKNVEYN